MNYDIEQFVSRSKDETLPEKRRSAMRESLVSFMDAHPVRKENVARHQIGEGNKKPLRATKPKQNTFMMIGLIVALILSGGTAFASESALPGDTLYGVKIHVNENVRSFAAVSHESQAKWDAERAKRRLEEAQVLAIEGRLNAETRAELQANFDASIKSAEAETDAVGRKDGPRAAALRIEINAALAAEEQGLVESGNAGGDARIHVDPILIDLRGVIHADGSAFATSSQKGRATASATDVKVDGQIDVETVLPSVDLDLRSGGGVDGELRGTGNDTDARAMLDAEAGIRLKTGL